ncbi:leucine-rich repeat domain-containing protein [Candidatus Rhabdochlamydia porcellionis]|uniref:Leucine rich repeat n=1 Tax=Candidatus Rhabdochlamydia porcellionis TaxID=225148 RepID=A0ABX8Z581_9BACT|nr:NEL-type E3 ubiquitin ligase domain-containing protein [Candidatus Rhabdochlamydia porcellionis]QZA59212.1 Leucine rich repeat [Candidatus Rhabdochlamydia porcellionis]
MTINSSNNDSSQLKYALTTILEEWQKEAPSEENRREAAKRILDFFHCKGKSLLDLSYLNLSSLPDVFSYLSELEELNLNGNRLTTLLDATIDLTALKLKIIHINNKTLTTLFDILTYRSILTQKQQLDHALNQWIEESPSEENQIEAKKRILDFFNNSTKQNLNLSSLNLSSLPNIFNISCFCYRLKQLDLSENQLTTLPDTFGNLSQLTSLSLNINQLTTLPDTFGNLSQLTSLSLNINQLTTLPDTFGNLSQLTWLDLSTNQLTALPDTFGNLSQLTSLGLNNNQLTTLPDTFGNLSQLTWLNFSTNQLTTLPDTFGNLSQLTRLNLSTNQLITLPDTLGYLSQLTMLSLSTNQLTTLPDTFGNLSRLTWLDLSINQLRTLPDTFGNLSQLKQLNLSTNQLRTLPDTFGNLSQLKQLNLSTNQLTTLPNTLGYLSQLTWLNLSVNQLTTLPSTFGNLSQLITLYLNTNQLTTLPSTFGNLSRLTWLNLKTNQLTTLPNTFGNLSQLTTLHLTANQLTALPDTFGNLSQLTWLNLSNNQLTTLPDTFGNLSQLITLYLNTNKFTTLPDTFGNLTQLTRLNLNTNQLTTLPDTFGNLTQLTRLNLNTNQLTTLPDTFGNLTQLIRLNLNTNQLTTLPDTLGNLSQLTWLNLSTNQLIALPDTFGNLSRLKTLELSNNYSLTKIPLKILELPESSVIALRGNHNIDPVILEQLLTAIASFRYKGPKVILHDTMKEFVAMMYQLIKKPPREFSKLEESEDLYLWLKRLFDIADFKKGGELQKELITQVINYLTEANDNQEFRATFDTIIHDAVRTCGDRMALSIINLGVAHQLATVSFTNMHALADLLKGLWAINMLEAIAENKISVLRSEAEDPDQEVDEVEIYLGYLIKLKEDLNLPVNMQNMLFFDCSQLTPDDLEKAKAFVLSQQSHQKAYFEFLNLHDKWIAALSTHYKEEYQAIVDARENSANLENPDYIAIGENFNKQLEALTEKALSKRVSLYTLDTEDVVNS